MKKQKNKLLPLYFFGGTLIIFIAVLLFANNNSRQLKTYTIGELMFTEGWDWNTMTTSDPNYQDAVTPGGVSMYRDESGSSSGTNAGESSGTSQSSTEKGTVLGAEGDIQKVVCDGGGDCYAESYFLKEGMQNIGSSVRDENGNYTSGYVDEDLVNTLIAKGYDVSWQDYELVVGYTGCTGQCYDSSGLHESDGEFEYFVRDYTIIDPQTGEELDLDLTSTGGMIGYQYWEATDNEGDVVMEIGLEGNDLGSDSASSSYSLTSSKSGSSSRSSTGSSVSRNDSKSVSSKNESPAATAKDDSVMEAAKSIADDKTKLDLSDVSELEKSYLGISGKTGTDLNGDDIFSYADVVTLAALYLESK